MFRVQVLMSSGWILKEQVPQTYSIRAGASVLSHTYRAILPMVDSERRFVMAASTLAPAVNRLLAQLPPEEMGRLLPHLRPVSFALGEVVYESGGRQSYIYFPTTAIISLLYLMENGSSAEMGVAGNEGLVGVALFMGGDTDR